MTLSEKFLPYSNQVEQLLPDEQKLNEDVDQIFLDIQNKIANKRKCPFRGAHSKQHGILKGTLTIYDDLPEWMYQGIIQKGRTYGIVARLSTSPSDIFSDSIGGFRGLGIKIIGVEGEQLLQQNAGAHTQDFLFINHPAFPAKNLSDFLLQAKLLNGVMINLPDALQEAQGMMVRAGGDVARMLGFDPAGTAVGMAKPESHILGDTFHSGAPVRYGAHLAKVSVAPLSENVRALAEERVDIKDHDALQHVVRNFFMDKNADYELRFQLCTNLEDMPVEVHDKEWSAEESPHVAVGKIAFPIQDTMSPAKAKFGEEVLEFSPWHGVTDHQPLGSIMRARKTIYENSSQFRHSTLGVKRAEPSALSDIPD